MIFDAAQDPIQVVQTGGMVGLLITVLLGGHRKWWVFGWRYSEVVKERDEWRELALRSANLAESLNEIQKRKVGLL